MRVSEICVKQIRVNQGLGVHFFSSCVPNPNCNGKVETDSKMKSDCFNMNNPTDERICCNDNDRIEVPPPCSELPEYR